MNTTPKDLGVDESLQAKLLIWAWWSVCVGGGVRQASLTPTPPPPPHKKPRVTLRLQQSGPWSLWHLRELEQQTDS